MGDRFFFVFIYVFLTLVCLFLCLFLVSYFSLSQCLGCFRYYVFKVHAFMFLYLDFTCSHVLGFFRSIFMF